MTDNYLDRYLKIDILNEITETLFSTVSDSEVFEKLIDHAKIRYFELQNKVRLGEMSDQERVQRLESEGVADSKTKILVQSRFNKVGYKVPLFEKNPESTDSE